MNPLIYIALFGWIPAVVLIFAALPSQRAVVVATIAAWLFLPVAALPLPGLPDYTKTSATTAGVLLGGLLFNPGRLASVRPRWFDLPLLAWCLLPLATSLLNGLGLYDGLSGALAQTITWGLPYFIGRAYLGDVAGLRELAVGIVIGGLLYVPLCLFEVRMSPQLHRMVYGFHQHSFAQAIRYGGFRPTVFMAHGLEVGMWLTSASLIAYGLWAAGALRRLAGLPVGTVVLPLLVGTALLCKSIGALILLAVGLAALWSMGRTGRRLPVFCLILIVPLYVGTRLTGAWAGRGLVASSTAWFGPERAQSLETRLENEDLLITKALQRPVFGWGGWGRSRVHDTTGRDISIADSLWIITLGMYGMAGLGAVSAAILLPAVLALRRPPGAPGRAAPPDAGVLAVLLSLYMIDNLSNAMLNPVYLLVMGGLSGIGGRRGAAAPDEVEDEPAVPNQGELPGDPDQCALLAGELITEALRLNDLGRQAEAETAWAGAAELWAALVAAHPEHAEYRGRWLETLNDLAWFLANAGGPDVRDPGRAVQLAHLAVSGDPDRGTFWNTYGAALYRAGEWDAAIGALERSIELHSGGTGHDFVFRAMAHRRRGEPKLARAWLARADTWALAHGPPTPELLELRAEAERLLTQGEHHDPTPNAVGTAGGC